jgi:hypothetical protein
MIEINYTQEIIITFLTGILLFVFLYKFTIQKLELTSSMNKRIFALLIIGKLCFALFFAIIHYTRYKFSDTMLYHEFSIYFNRMPLGFFDKTSDLMTNNSQRIYAYLVGENYPMQFREAFLRNPQNILVLFNSFLNRILFNSLFAKTLVYSSIGYIALLQWYRFSIKKFPNIPSKYWLIPFFLYPSLLFWSSGILKEAPTLLGMSLSIYYFNETLLLKNYTFKNYSLLGFGILICLIIKPFIFIILLIALVLYYTLEKLNQIDLNKNNFLRIAPIVLIGTFALLMLINSDLVGHYKLEKALPAANKLYKNLSSPLVNAGSAYTIPNSPTSLIEIIKLVPFSIGIVLFRPFWSEAHNALTKIAALESLLLLAFTIFALYRGIIQKRFLGLLNEPFMISCLVACLIYFFFIAISSANFGTLVRYKILVIPFYLSILVWLAFSESKDKQKPLN